MIIKLTQIIDRARNKFGSAVFSEGRYGPYVRELVTPDNPKTSYQVLARARATQCSQAWRTLSEANRIAWEAFADVLQTTNAFGHAFTPSGINAFIKINVNRLLMGKSILQSPPPLTYPAPLTVFTKHSWGEDELGISFTPTPLPAKNYLFLWSFAPQSAGKSFFDSEYRLLRTFIPATTSPIYITDDYSDRFGWWPAGAKIGCIGYLVHEDTGLESSPLSFVDIVV